MSHYPKPNLIKAPLELSYSTQSQAVETVISRTNSSQYLVLDSKNRNQVVGTNVDVNVQAWNNFRLQKPSSIMESFATRVVISEIRFPWWIPNITSRNNLFVFIEGFNDYTIELQPGFYTPAAIVQQINNAFNAMDVNLAPILSYYEGQYTFTQAVGVSVEPKPAVVYPLIVGNVKISKRIRTKKRNIKAPVEAQAFVFYDGGNAGVSENLDFEEQNLFYSQPSLMNTLGFIFDQCSTLSNPFVGVITGNPTETLYTQYVDIVSNKINQYTTNIDGTSNANSSTRLLLRLYLSDEVSIFNNYGTDDIYQPFLIHRQFKNPKMVMWNKDAVIDWIDIQVVDQYNNLIELPKTTTGEQNPIVGQPTIFVQKTGAYPDFQITLLATEN
jgi:hypothetical protein